MNHPFIIQYITDEPAMLSFGARVASACFNSTIIFLYGNLGAGKTTFTRGFLQGLGYQGIVKSPTYTLVESYHFQHMTVFHFDFYRIHTPEELEYIGIQDFFTPHAICLIEWPEQGQGILPPPDLSCYIALSKTGREIKMMAQSSHGEDIVKRLQNEK